MNGILFSLAPVSYTHLNRDCTGIYFAVDYLTKATKHLLDNTEEISAKYKHVVIVGGGAVSYTHLYVRFK